MKKGNLWIFGDSYATVPEKDYEENKHWYWMPSLAEKLGHNDFYNVAHNGAANEWSYFNFVNNLNQINSKEDSIVFIVTQIHRQWFFTDNIGVSNHYMADIENYVDKDNATAIKYYQKYLSNNPQDFIRAQSLLYSLEYIKERKNLNLIVLPGFRETELDYGESKGCLFDVCVNEIKGKSFNAWWNFIVNTHKGMDPRAGHLSKLNHTILVDKLYNSFVNKNLLDLTSGFEEEIL